MSLEKKKRGRPRGKVRETHTVYLRLPTHMVAQVRSLAKERGWTMNRWVETVIQNVIRREAKTDGKSAPDGHDGDGDGDGRDGLDGREGHAGADGRDGDGRRSRADRREGVAHASE